MSYFLSPIGFVSSTRKTRDDRNWDTEIACIQLTDSFQMESLAGLDQFSHVLVVFLMHEVAPGDIVTGSRHPRDRRDLPEVGIFAQRASGRPNRLGVTVCRILKVEDNRVNLEGLDAINGTPVIDLKPWIAEFGPRGEVNQPAWVTEIMKDYWRS